MNKGSLVFLFLLGVVAGIIGSSLMTPLRAQPAGYDPPHIFLNGTELKPVNNRIDIHINSHELFAWVVDGQVMIGDATGATTSGIQ